MDSKTPVDVTVVGGGVIGWSSALELARGGARVRVLDTQSEPGHGCSFGNAGWLTPCFALPLPMPGMFLKSIKWLLDPESPLYIQPRPSLHLMAWLARFLHSMNEKQMRESVNALTRLSVLSLDAYKRMHAEGDDFGFEQKGLLLAGISIEGFEAAQLELDLVGKHGINGRVLNADETHQLEPALHGKIQGAVYFPDEAHAEPLEVVKRLVREATKLGVTWQGRTEVYDYEWSGRGKVEALLTTTGRIALGRSSGAPGQLLLATGTWSNRLAGRLGLRVPVMGGKGYSLILPKLEVMPKLPIMIVDRKIAITPRRDSLRIAGTLELVGEDLSITPRRVAAIMKGAKSVLDFPAELEAQSVWRGLRPCTPDGVPILGAAPGYQNVWIATGHQMLGLQSAPGSGKLIADLMLGRKPDLDPKPFRAERF